MAKLATARAARTDTPIPDAETIIAAIPDALLLIDERDVVRFVNSAAEPLLGAGAGKVCGRLLDDLLRFDNPLISLVAKVREEGTTITEHDIDIAMPRGAARAIDVKVSAVAEAPGWVLALMRGRSIAHKLDRQLTHLGAGRSVAGLAAALAHEIKNPLSGIRGAAQLLEHSASAEERELTRLITEETDRICRLVDRMEVFSDTRPGAREAVNIHEVLDHVRRLASTGFAGHASIVELYDPSLPAVLGDRDGLVQVFLNLLKNAAEAVPAEAGEIILKTAFEPGLRLSIGGERGRQRLPLVVSIEDNGPGVSADMQGHLFDPFVSGKAGGTGLGLSLVAKIIGDHGGIVEFESEPGHTTFRVLLPLHPGDGSV